MRMVVFWSVFGVYIGVLLSRKTLISPGRMAAVYWRDGVAHCLLGGSQ